jgi:hypothetical protein
MADISRDAAVKFHAYKRFKRTNTRVEIDNEGNAHMFHHGSLIAIKKTDGSIYVTNAGWFSRTTKERLNEVIIPGRITQKNWKWSLNGTPWNGSWALIINGDPISIAILDNPPM